MREWTYSTSTSQKKEDFRVENSMPSALEGEYRDVVFSCLIHSQKNDHDELLDEHDNGALRRSWAPPLVSGTFIRRGILGITGKSACLRPEIEHDQ